MLKKREESFKKTPMIWLDKRKAYPFVFGLACSSTLTNKLCSCNEIVSHIEECLISDTVSYTITVI